MTTRPNDLDNSLIQPDHYGRSGSPHERWAWLRTHDPVHWTEPDGLHPFWAVTTANELMEVSSQPEIFSNAAGGVVVTSRDAKRSVRAAAIARVRPYVPAAARRRLRRLRPGDAFRPIVQMDPPDHRVYRRVTAGYFSPHGITAHADLIARAAATVLDAIDGTTDEFDFVEMVGRRLPIVVLSELLGLDERQRDEVLFLTTNHYEGDLSSDAVSAGAERERWITLIDEIVADRRTSPRDDLATLLATARVEGDLLQGPELRGYFLILFTAGHDTTGHSLAGAVDAFADAPEEFARLRADATIVESAVEEIVRWSTPVNYMKRTALRDYELNGTRIRKGDELVLFYGSACRDRLVYDEPDRFDIGRPPNRRLGFGWAGHHCLGAHLARATISAFLVELRSRVVGIERVAAATYTPASFVTGHRALPVRFEWDTPSEAPV